MLTDFNLWYLTTNWKHYSTKFKLRDKVVIENKTTGAYCDIGKYGDDLIIAFKGTELKLNDIISDILFSKKVYPYGNFESKIKVHQGFICQYKSIRDDIQHHLATTDYDKVYVIGHSLGGALATLCIVDLDYTFAYSLLSLEDDLHGRIFGSPRVGNRAFTKSFNKRLKNFKNYQVKNDTVTKLPLKIMGFSHVKDVIKLGKLRWWFPFGGHLNYYKYL